MIFVLKKHKKLIVLLNCNQKLLSTCVNSQIALNAYNKSQGISGDRSGGDRSQAANESSSSYQRSSNGGREISNGKGGRGGGGSNRGSGRGGGGYNSDRSSNGPSLSSSVTSANQSGRERVDRGDRTDRSGRGGSQILIIPSSYSKPIYLLVFVVCLQNGGVKCRRIKAKG